MAKITLFLIGIFLLSSCVTDPLYRKPEYKLLKINASSFGATKTFPTMQPGVIQLSSGVYSGPLSFSGKKKYEIIGAGTDKTLIQLKDKKGAHSIDINSAHVVFKNVTIENGSFKIKSNGRGDFVRVDFAENLTFWGQPGAGSYKSTWPQKLQVRMVNVTIPEYKAIKVNYTQQNPFSPLYAKGIWLALSRTATMKPASNLNYYVPEGIHWHKLKTVKSFNSPEVKKVMGQTYGQFKKRKRRLRPVEDKFQDELFLWANNERFSVQPDSSNKSKSVVTDLVNKADRHHRKKNYLLEFYALHEADVANQFQPNQEVKKRQERSFKKLSELYGCQATYTRAKNGTIFLKNSWGLYDISTAHKMFINTADKVIPFVTALGSSHSKCFLELLAVQDYFKGEDSEKKVVAEQANWVESQESKDRRRALQEAAKEARWRASQNQFSSSLNRLSSTAKQLHENRNRLEERSDGLYLVSPNKRIKGASLADIQKQNRLDAEARKTARAAQSQGTQYVRKGKIQTLNYFKTWTDKVQFNLRLTKNKQQLNYEFPLKKTSRSRSCRDTKNTSSRFNTGLDDTCRKVYYHENRNLRKHYIEKFIELPVQNFLTTQVLPDILREIQQKANSNDKESQLEALLLANLMADKKDPALDKKAVEALGHPIDYEDYKKTFLNYR